MSLYEILVPKYIYDEVEWDMDWHYKWDAFVNSISKGMTVLRSVKGTWFAPSNEIVIERMIPVRLICNREQIEQIIDFTKKHYNQKAVMAYKVSDEVIIR